MPFFFSLFGLRLQCNQRIPGLIKLPDDGQTDILVKLCKSRPGKIGETIKGKIKYESLRRDTNGRPILTVLKMHEKRCFQFLYSDGIEFIIDFYENRILGTWPDPLTIEDAATYLLGPVIGFILRIRGVVCLHASAVGVNNRAIAFMNPASGGKSTTAAALAKLGYPVLSDDIVALIDEKKSFLVQPGYPRLQLWPPSVEALFGSSDALPRISPKHPTWDKRYLDLQQCSYRFENRPLPLGAIFTGESNPAYTPPRVELQTGAKRLLILIANTYATYHQDKTMRACEFDVLNRLAAGVPLLKIHSRANLSTLPRLIEAILGKIEALS